MLTRKNVIKTIKLFTLLILSIACNKNTNTQQTTELQISNRFTATEKRILSDFLKSREYKRVLNETIDKSGNLDLNTTSFNYVENDLNKPVINLVYSKEKITKAILHVIPLKSELSNVLPNNEHYLMLLVDYKSYDTKKLTGNIKLFDLNYENYLAGEIDVKDAKILKLIGLNMPKSIEKKYTGLMKKNELGNPIFLNRKSSFNENNAEKHFCDGNGNGNVGFGECMSCMTSACNGDATCATFCSIVNVAGIGTSTGGQCTISMLAACAYISIAY